LWLRVGVVEAELPAQLSVLGQQLRQLRLEPAEHLAERGQLVGLLRGQGDDLIEAPLQAVGALLGARSFEGVRRAGAVGGGLGHGGVVAPRHRDVDPPRSGSLKARSQAAALGR
jgi:hypothetical protein